MQKDARALDTCARALDTRARALDARARAGRGRARVVFISENKNICILIKI